MVSPGSYGGPHTTTDLFFTPWDFNMEPDKYTPGKGKLSSQSHHFQVRAVNLRGCNKKNTTTLPTTSSVGLNCSLGTEVTTSQTDPLTSHPRGWREVPFGGVLGISMGMGQVRYAMFTYLLIWDWYKINQNGSLVRKYTSLKCW